MSLPSISPDSAQFGRMERLLQVQLNAPQLRIGSAFCLTDRGWSSLFEQRCNAMTRPNLVTAFLPVSQIPQTPDEIATSGIKFDPNVGLRVNISTVKVDRSAEFVELLHVTIALGHTINHQRFELTPSSDCPFIETSPTRADLPPGYHTLCVSPAGEYVIFSRTQIHCTALLRLAGGANLAEPTEGDDLCDVCRSCVATVWCVNDFAKLCASCDESSHSTNNILARHERIPLHEAWPLMDRCPLHERCHFQFYCPVCRLPLCANCKLDGSHSRGPEATHALIPIQEAYASTVLAVERGDPIIAERRAVIKAKLATCAQALYEAYAQQAHFEAEVAQLVETAIEQERQVAAEKTLMIRSIQTELRRKLGEIAALRRSINLIRKGPSPQALLRAFLRHKRFVRAVEMPTDLPLEMAVYGDHVVAGRPPFETTFVRAKPAELGQLQKSAADALDAEILQLNSWVRSIMPEFVDIRWGFDDGVTLIRLLQAIEPTRRPSVVFPIVPVGQAQKREARRAAVLFAKELGAKGVYEETVLAAGAEDPSQTIALISSIQHDVAGVDREAKRVVSPTKAVRLHARERIFPTEPTSILEEDDDDEVEEES